VQVKKHTSVVATGEVGSIRPSLRNGFNGLLRALPGDRRYGTDGWTCQEAQPENGEQSVGGVYINESCQKTVQGRSITVERTLYRRADQDMKSFVDKTSVLIRRAQG
jgi:hypothetical protein